ncbi:MAG: alpha/beta fold hydrolase [Leptospiraceae bacterium]|nr:alpha/beta fold hydrolase [Leptospiraceae bacterium]MCP5511114.1 alpha/beta fold hydrolase [Leptospiraceae bacterium]
MNQLEFLSKTVTSAKKGIVLIHGFGANAEDLYPLSDYFRLSDPVNWFFPQAPILLGGMYGTDARAWFPLGVGDRIRDAVHTDDWSEILDYTPDGLLDARKVLNDFLDSLDIPYEDIVLGGFSQGAMLALDIFLSRKDKPLGLVLYSGTILHENYWKEAALEKSGYRFYQSHGTMDPLLPFRAAERLNGFLNESGMMGDLEVFTGGHEIPMSVLKSSNLYLDSCLKENSESS